MTIDLDNLPDFIQLDKGGGRTTIPKEILIKALSDTLSTKEEDDSVNIESYRTWVSDQFKNNLTGVRGLDLLHMVSGMSSEIGEVQDLVIKHVFHGKDLDMTDMTMELGDFMFYFMTLLNDVSIPLTDIIRSNKIKLELRYPDGRRDLSFKNKKLEYIKVKEALEKA